MEPCTTSPRRLRGPAALVAALSLLAVLPATAPASATSTTATPASATPATDRLQVEEGHSIVPVAALGDPEAARAAEGRRFRHSGLQPTGRFADAGQVLRVDVPEGAAGLVAEVALHGSYDGELGGTSGGTRRFALQPGENTVVAPFAGFLWLRDDAPESSRLTQVRVTGGLPVATFVEGQSTEAGFRDQVDRFDAPFAVLAGRRVLVEVQEPLVERQLFDKGIAVGPRVRMMDRVVATTDDVYGLSREAAGAAHRAPHRVHVVNPDHGPGYASAGDDRVVFQEDTGAMADLLSGRPTDQWGFWHEVGHTYQPDWVTWAGQTEVSVNISALVNQEQVSGQPGNRLDEAARRQAAARFFALPVAERRFDDGDVWLRLLLFDQLRRAFGDDLYARVAQEVRVARATGAPVPVAGDNTGRRNAFALAVARAADRDLSDFFAQWGFPLTEATVREMSAHPEPGFDLTSNRFRPDDRIEHEVAFAVPAARLEVGSLYQAQRTLSAGQLELGAGARVRSTDVQAWTVGAGTGRVTVVLADDSGTPDVLTARPDVVRGSMFSLRGAGGGEFATVVLDHAAQRLRAFRTGDRPSDPVGHAGREYVRAELLAADGTVLRVATNKGDEYADRFVRELDAVGYQQGQVLVLTHQGASSGKLVRWDDGALATSTASPQAYRIEGTRLVAIPLDEVPGR